MVKMKDAIQFDYESKVKVQQSLVDGLKSKLNRISFSRLGLFITEILVVAMVISFGFSWVFAVLLVVPLLLFVGLVKSQTKVQNELLYAEALLWIYQNELNQLTSGQNGYADGQAYESELHAYTSDLDIFGPRSLYANINRCNTRSGLNLLAASLSKSFGKKEIESRQEAIKELTERITDTFHFRAELRHHEPGQLEVIKEKLEHHLADQLTFVNNGLLRGYVKIAPFIMASLLTLAIVLGGLIWQFFALAALMNAALIFFNLAKINKVYYGFTGSSNQLSAFAGSIKWTEKFQWKSGYIKSMFQEHNANPTSAPVSAQIKELSRIIQAFDARLNILVALVLNVFLLWDLRCSVKLSDWLQRSSSALVQGLVCINRFEELISFATLAHNQTDWCYPSISDTFECRTVQLGHPLIHQQERIVNDFEFASQRTVDIVTGSNMAGKSTFLRTVGINMVLAFAGAPVCAKEMSVSVFSIYSYMRIKDSLNDQTSTFKAELNRLKMILDAIVNTPDALVLIDEMLRGTNSRDKYLGSKVFIEKLIAEQTSALFATHDLQLSDMVIDHAQKVRNYHFDIQISEGEMKFDYKLKPGPCKTFNAALLLKEIGLTLT